MTKIRLIETRTDEGEISPESLNDWAYDDDAIFADQDEDLLLHDINLLPYFIKLISDVSCPKRQLLFYIISYFTTLNFRHKRLDEINSTREIIKRFSPEIKQCELLATWADYFIQTGKLIFQSNNITKEIAEKYGFALLKGLAGTADLAPERQVNNSTWEVIYLAASVKPYIHVDIGTGNFEYKGYK